MGCCSSKQGASDPHATKRPVFDRATQLPPGLSFHLPTTGPLSPEDFRQRIVCSAGTQEIHLPISNYSLRYAFVSFRGYYPESLYKPSQDTACAICNFAGDPEQIFFGVFDGHGTSGTECSQFAKEQVSIAAYAVVVVAVLLLHSNLTPLACAGPCSNAKGPVVQILP